MKQQLLGTYINTFGKYGLIIFVRSQLDSLGMLSDEDTTLLTETPIGKIYRIVINSRGIISVLDEKSPVAPDITSTISLETLALMVSDFNIDAWLDKEIKRGHLIVDDLLGRLKHEEPVGYSEIQMIAVDDSMILDYIRGKFKERNIDEYKTLAELRAYIIKLHMQDYGINRIMVMIENDFFLGTVRMNKNLPAIGIVAINLPRFILNTIGDMIDKASTLGS
jgi:hypothetical protein